MEEGKLLGHIICKDGVKIDLERIEAIKYISFPINKKEIEYFLGKINFLCSFIPNFIEIVKPITYMLIKDHEIKWTMEARYSFEQIRKSIGESLVLISPDYSKEFIIFFNCLLKVLFQLFYYRRRRKIRNNL